MSTFSNFELLENEYEMIASETGKIFRVLTDQIKRQIKIHVKKSAHTFKEELLSFSAVV